MVVCFAMQVMIVPLAAFSLIVIVITETVLITPRRVGGGGVKQLVLYVRPSVRPSVRLSGVCPLKNRAISRFTGLSDC